uniref:D-inositol 3-phosphate glycosyltransferase n=1 Tax=Streptomyces sp. F12 TaxID=1436084 RepID=V9Z7S5_9ACTN|nr:glycosyltransferase [Streptomyces sp. F12]AHE40173.1 Glycosyl transferase [Streptomyces sp. F12]
MALSVDTAVLFYPRGGSAQVVRYLLHELNALGHTTRLHAGSLGKSGDYSHAATFYQGLNLHPFDYNAAHTAWKRGDNPQLCDHPFHPSYEDRGTCPDPLFTAVPQQAADHLTRTWTRHLSEHRSSDPDVLHLHHLSHLQTSAATAYRHTPRVTTLHGTELKIIQGMRQRLSLARRTGHSPSDLAHLLHSSNPRREAEASRLARAASLSDADTAVLTSTAWEKWAHSGYWLQRLHRAARQAGQLAAVSEHDQALASRLLHLREEIPVVPNGVDTHTFRPLNLDHTTRLQHLRRWLVDEPRGWAPGGAAGSIRYTDADLKRLHTPDGSLRPLLLWVGRFLDFKRVPVLLQAFASARTRLTPPPALLMWGGYPGEYEGDHPADLAEKLGIADDVYFIGWRGHDELPLGLDCADLMVAPAVNEPFGMVYLEAQACGTPPITTSTGGPARLITSQGPRADGWLVPPDDPAALADTVTGALTDRTERRRRALNARAHVESTYSWARTAQHYLALYASALRH